MFFNLFGYWVRGSLKGLVDTLLMIIFTPSSPKSQFPKLISLDIVITQIDQPTYVWCVVGHIDEFFTLFRSLVGVGGLGGIPKGLVHNLLFQVFALESSKITKRKLFDQIQAGPCIWQNTTYPPVLGFLGLFAYPTPRGCIVGLTPCKTIVLSNTHIPQAAFGPETHPCTPS